MQVCKEKYYTLIKKSKLQDKHILRWNVLLYFLKQSSPSVNTFTRHAICQVAEKEIEKTTQAVEVKGKGPNRPREIR